MSEEKNPESLSVPSSSGQSTSPGVSKRHGLTRAATGIPGAIQKDDQDFTKRRRSVYGMSQEDAHAQEEDFIAQRIQEDQGWVRTQTKTFTRWVNENLKTTEHKVESLDADFGDGLKLVALLQQLAGKPIGARITKKPRIRAQKLENVKLCFDFMGREGIELVNIDNQDVSDGNMKLILGLVWHLILHYQIATGFEDDGSKGGPKLRIIKWVNSKINPWDKNIGNLGPDWNDGSILACLVNALAPGLVPDFAAMNPEEARDNIDRAMDMAEKWMDIPRVLEPEDMMDPHVDELSMMTYLSYFPNAKVKDGAPCCFPQRVVARGPGITGVGLKPGCPAQFEIDATKAGESGRGKIKVEVIGPDGNPVQTDFVDNGDLTYSGAYHPEDDGDYIVKVSLFNCSIPKSPFKIGIYGDQRLDINKVKVEGPGITGEGILPGDVAPFTITYKDAGRGIPKVDVFGPDHQPLTIVEDNDKKEGVCNCEYQPGVFGEYTVAITYAGLPLPNSPFKVMLKPTVDIGKVKTEGPGLSRCKVDEPTWFKVHTNGAGKGKLDLKIEQTDGTLIEPVVNDDGKGTYTVEYTPKMVGNFKVSISYGRCKLPKSAFNVTVVPPGDAGEVVVSGDGLKDIRVGFVGKIFVDASKAGKGDINCIIIGPDNKPLEIGCEALQLVKCQNGITEYAFKPDVPGPFIINVTFAGQPVPGSAFHTTVRPSLDIERIKLLIDRENPPRINKPYKFTVDCQDAGMGPVTFGMMGDPENDNPNNPRKDILVIVCDADGKPINDKKGKPLVIEYKVLSSGVAHFTFTPEVEGPLFLKVQYDSVNVPKSPMRVTVGSGIDMSKVQLYGDGITSDSPVRANKPMVFTIDCSACKAGPVSLDYAGKYTINKFDDTDVKDMKMNVIGPDGKPMLCDVKKKDDCTFIVTLKPELVGMMSITLIGGPDGRHAPRSPLKINVKPSVDASKLIIGGDGIEKDKVPREGKLCVLDIDGGKAGKAPFSVSVNGQDKTPEGSKKPGKKGKTGGAISPSSKDPTGPLVPGFGADGKPSPGMYISPDGTICDDTGAPVLSADNKKPLKCGLGGPGGPKSPKTDDNGNLLGPDGKPLEGSDGTPVKAASGKEGPTTGPDGTIFGSDGKPLLGSDGKPLKAGQMYDGKPLCNNEGELLAPNGKPVIGPNGEPIKSGKNPIGLSVEPSGAVLGPAGEPFCGADGNPLFAGMDANKKPVIDGKGCLCGPDGQPLVGPDGKGIKPGAGSLGPNVKPDGSLVNGDGSPVLGPDGKPLKCAMGPNGKPTVDDDGNLVGTDGKPLFAPCGNPTKSDKDGNLLGPDGKPLLDASGNPIPSAGKPYVGPDGTLYGPAGNPLIGPDGKPLFAKLGPDGKPLFDEAGNLLGPDGKPLLGADGRPFNKGAIGPDGSVFGPDGKPILDKDGKPVKAGLGNPLKAPDAFPGPHIGEDGGVTKTDGTPLIGSDGNPLKVATGGKPQSDPKTGNLLGDDGKPLIGADGKPVTSSGGPYGPLVCPDGLVEGPGGNAVPGPDGKPLFCEQKPDNTPCKDGDGNLVGADGGPLLGPDTNPVNFGKDTDTVGDSGPAEDPCDINVVILGPDGKPIAAVVKDLGDGKLQVQYEPENEGPHTLDVTSGGDHAPKCPVEIDVKPELKLDGLNLGFGTGVTVGPDGTLFGADGKPLLDKNGKPIKCKLGPDGKPLRDAMGNLIGENGKPLVDENGNLLGPDGKPLLGPDGKPIKAPASGITVGDDGTILGPDGKPLLDKNGKPLKCKLGPDGKPLVDANGNLLGPDGKPLLGPDGKPLKALMGPPKTDKNGNLLGPNGKPLLDADGKPISMVGKPYIGPDGTLYGPDGKPLLGPDGKPLKCGLDKNGNPLFDKDGNLLGPDGKPLIGPDGKPFNKGAVGPDGSVFGPDGKPVLGPDGKPVKAGLGKPMRADGKPLMDSDKVPEGNGLDLKIDPKALGCDSLNIKSKNPGDVTCPPGPCSGPYVDKDGVLHGPTGDVLRGPDGKPLEAAMGADGKPITDADGNILGKDGKPLIGPDGNPVKLGSGPYGPCVGPDGTPYDKNGNPLLGPNGKPLKGDVGPDGKPLVDGNGNLLNAGGAPLLDKDGKNFVPGEGPYVGPDGTVYAANGEPMTKTDGKPFPKAGMDPKSGFPMYDPKSGGIVYPDGKPLIGDDGKPLRAGTGPYAKPDGEVFASDGSPLCDPNGEPNKAALGDDKKPITDAKGYLVGPDGKPCRGPDGKPIKPNANGPTGAGCNNMRPDGHLMGPNGQPLIGADGLPLIAAVSNNAQPKVDPNGNMVGKDQKPLVGADGKPVKPGQGDYGPRVGPDGTVFKPDGSPVQGAHNKPVKAGLGPDGRPMIDENGNIIGPDGAPLLGKDGKKVPVSECPYVGGDGTCYKPDGTPIGGGKGGKPLIAGKDTNGKPLTDNEGNVLGPDCKPLVGPDGKPLKGGMGPYVSPDESVMMPNGKPIKGADKKPLKAGRGPNGEPSTDAQGNVLDPNGQNILGKDNKPIHLTPNGPAGPGPGSYIGPDGILYGPDGKPLLGPDGKPIRCGLGPDGKPLVDDEGFLLGPDGKRILGPDGKPIRLGSGPYGPGVGPDGTVYGSDGKPVIGPDGNPVKCMLGPDGRPLCDKNGNLLGPDGKPLTDKNGNPIKPGADGAFVGPDGTVYGPDGKPLLGPDGKPLKCMLGPDGLPMTDKDGNLLGPDGKPLKGPDGKPVKLGAGPTIGPDGIVYGPDGKPLLGPDGKPLVCGLGPDGKPLTDRDGYLVGPDGKRLLGPDGKPIKATPGGPDGPGCGSYVGPDGTLYGPDGKPLLGPDGKPLKAGLNPDGSLMLDADGNMLGPDGKPLVGPDGKPIKPGSGAYGPGVGADGTVYGPDGKPVIGPDGKPVKALLGPPGCDKDGNILGPDGKPLLDKNGKPVSLDGKPFIGPDGTLYGPDGQPILGPDGLPLKCGLDENGNPLFDANGNLLGPDGKPLLGPDGKPFNKGAVGPNGCVFGPDGKPILDKDGNPLRAGLGAPRTDKDGNLIGPDGGPLRGADGKPLRPGCLPYVGPDGTVYGPDGKPLLDKDGNPLKAMLGPDGKPMYDHNGNLLGPDGKPLLGPDGLPMKTGAGPHIGPDGTVYGPDGKPILGPDGLPLKCMMTPDGKPFTDANGNLLGPDGKPLLGPDGKPIKPAGCGEGPCVGPDGTVYAPGNSIGPDGTIYGPDGKPLLGPDGKPLKALMGPPGTDEFGNILGPDGKPVLDKDGNTVSMEGKPYIGPDGALYGPDGKPILGPDGKPLKCGLDKDGNPMFDKDGNLLGPDGKPLVGPDGKPFTQGAVGPNGTVFGPDGKPILDKDGNPIKAGLGPALRDALGNLLGPDGKPLKDKNGKPVTDGPQALLGPDGKPLKAGLGPDGKPLVGPNGELLGPDGLPLCGPDGKPMKAGNGPCVGPDGTLYGPDGKPVLGPDGKPLKAALGPDGKPLMDKDGNLIGPDGKPLVGGNGGPKVGKDGGLLGPNGLPLLGADGKPLKCGVDKDGNPLTDKDGNLLGPDGKPLLGPDGKPIQCALGPDGKPLRDEFGNLLGPDGKPLMAGCPIGSGLPKSGGPIVASDGTLLGPDGKPLLGPDGKPLKAGLGPDGNPLTDANGNLLGPDGKPLLGPDGKPIKAGTSVGKDGMLMGPDGKPILGADGKPIFAALGPDGKPLLDDNGNMLGPDGQPLLGPDGKPIKGGLPAGGPMIGPDGTLLGPDGNPLLGADGKPLKAALGPDGLPMVDSEGNVLGPNGKPLLGPNGKPIKAGPAIGKDGVLRGPDGNPIMGKDGKPQTVMLDSFGNPMMGPDGEMLGADGLPIIGPDGKPLNHSKPPTGPPVGPDGSVYGPDGKPLLGADGKPLKAGIGPDGLPLMDKDGNLLGPDGKPLKGANGMPVHAGPCIGKDGVVRNPDGSVVKGLDGQPVKAMLGPDGKLMVGPDGTLLGPDGKPLCGPDGKPMGPGNSIGPDGTLYGPDGSPLLGPDGKPLKCGLGPDGKPMRGPDGALLGPDGKPLVGPDGNLIGPDGKPLVGPDGRAVAPGSTVGPDGTVYGPDGKPVLGPDGKPLKAGLGPDGKPLRAADGSLLDADGNPLVDANGKPVKPGTSVGPDGTLYGPDGKPLLGNGGPKVGKDGSLTLPNGLPVLGPDGKPLKCGLDKDGYPLCDKEGRLLGPDGKPLLGEDGKPIFCALGPDGKPLMDEFGNLLGPDGKPIFDKHDYPLKAGLDKDGKPLVGPDGNFLGPDGKSIVGPDGKPIGPASSRTHATGLGPDGKPLGPLGADGRPLPFEAGGDMTVMCVGPNGELIPVEVVENDDGTYSVKASPDYGGDFVADIIGPDGKVLASIPFHCEPPIDASKIKLSGDSIDGVLKKDQPSSFQIDTSDAGKGPFTVSPFHPDTVKNGGIPGFGDKDGKQAPGEESSDVKLAVVGPNGEPLDCIMVDLGNGKFDVQFRPDHEGSHKIVVLANDEMCPGAPMDVKCFPNGDASKCKAHGPGLEPRGLMAGKPGAFKVDAQRAGDGEVEVFVKSPNPKYDAQIKCNKRGKGIFDCEYNPSLKGPYEVTVLFAGEDVPGSCFKVDVMANPNAEKIVVSGKGLKKGWANKPNRFTVNPNGAEGALNFDVEGPSKCDIDVNDNGDGTVTVTYTPHAPGEYVINVTLDGAQAPGGPFFPQIEEPAPSDASKVGISGNGVGNNVKTGVPATIKLDASEAGPGDFDVILKGPNGQKLPHTLVDNEDGTYNVNFIPEDVGNLDISVKFDGKPCPGSPLVVPVKAGIDANKVRIGGDGLKNPRVKHDNFFTMDCSDAGPGDDIKVTIIPMDKNGNPVRGTKGVPCVLKDLGNSVTSCTFNPDLEGPYIVDVKFCGKNPKEFPQKIVVKGPGAMGCRLPNIEGMEVEPNQELTIPVDISGAGPGKFEAYCVNITTGEKDVVRVTDGPNNMKNVTLKPTGAGPHCITMLFDDEDLPGGPYTFAVKKPVGADACSMRPNKDGSLFKPVGDFMTFLIDMKDAGPGNMTGVCKTPSGKNIPVTVEVDPDTGLANIKFSSTEKGVHMINILFNGHPIPGCPFELDIKGPADVTMNGGKSKDPSGSICLDMTGPNLVVVPNLVNCKILTGQDVKIPIDLTFSGDGKVEVTCIHDQTLERVPAKLIDTPNGKEVQVKAGAPGWYTLHIKYNDENLPGSPYKFEVKAPTGADTVVIKRGPKSPLKEGEPIDLVVDVSKAGDGQLTATCKGPNSSNVPVTCKVRDDGDIDVSFYPKGDGDHTLNLLFANRAIPGCPAIINVTHATPDTMGILLELAPQDVDCGAKGAKGVRHPDFADINVQLNQTLRIPLDLTAAGPGNVEVSCMHEKSKQPCPVQVIPTKQGAVEISVKPLELGPHLLHITFNGVDLPKSPFRFNVDRPSGANAVTVKQKPGSVKVVKDGVQFTIDTSRAGAGVLTAACTGPDGSLVPVECKKSGGDQLVTIKPNKAGLHMLEVMWDGQQIPGSPIELMINFNDGRIMYELCDILLLLMGAFTVRTPDLSNIQLETNQFIRIPIDCRLAGPGKLQVTCKNEDTGTSIDCEMKKNDDMYEITIRPTDPGRHALNIMWDGKHIPGSPAFFTVKGPAPARLCYILSGADHIKCSKGSISFRCTTKEAGKGELTAIGVDPFGKQFLCEITEEADLQYAIAFKPEVPGVHNVDVKFNGLSINGSPALIDIKSLPQGDEGGISLELISCRDTTASGAGTDTQIQQKATITLPIPKKDHAGLAVSCKGPDGAVVKCELGEGSDTGINILFEPSTGGKYTLTVMSNGNNYPGTPVDVEVQGL